MEAMVTGKSDFSAQGAWSASALLPHLSRDTAYETFLDRYGLLAEQLFRAAGLFARVEAGLRAIGELRERLDGSFLEIVRWDEVELMWLFHGAGDAGLPLDALEPRALRERLVALQARHDDRKSLARDGEIDTEAALCAFIGKLVSAPAPGTSRIADVWRRIKGGAQLEPEHELALLLDTEGAAYLRRRVARAMQQA
jgi:hypothetical protein